MAVDVTTGNNYWVPRRTVECEDAGGSAEECLPPWNSINSFVALDLRTGKIKWTTGQNTFDTWNVACIQSDSTPNNCPVPTGPDYDFGDGPHLFALDGTGPLGRLAVGGGDKGGAYYMLDAQSGRLLWRVSVGPGGLLSGIEWGTASAGKPQVPEPHGDLAHGAVSTANGVVYAGAMSGYMHALDARTGALLWQFWGQGSSNAGPAVAGGSVYWGNGCAQHQGTASNTFYAFTVPEGCALNAVCRRWNGSSEGRSPRAPAVALDKK